MAYPSPPEIATSYTAVEQALGDGKLPGQEMDVDLASLRASVTAVIEFLKIGLRSDGKLNNGAVTKDSLSSGLIIGLDTPGPWATATAYTNTSLVFQGFGLYLCRVPHTSTVFATDLASGRWQLVLDLTPPGGALIASNNLSDLPSKSAARTNLQLGTMATVDSGTGAAQFRTNLQNEAFFQPLAAPLTSWAALTRASGFDTFVATPSSANLRALLTDESGSGALLFAGGAMGTPSSLDLTNATGLTSAGIAPTTLVTASETIAANNNDTTLPTSAAVFGALPRVLLASKTASASATLDFTEFNNAVYRYYEFEFEAVLPATNSVTLNVLLSTDGGATYNSGASDYAFSAFAQAAGGSLTTVSSNATGALTASFTSDVASTGGNRFGVTGSMRLAHAGNGALQTRVSGRTDYDNSAGVIVLFDFRGVRRASQDTDAIRFLFSSGNIASGTIRMYGVR